MKSTFSEKFATLMLPGPLLAALLAAVLTVPAGAQIVPGAGGSIPAIAPLQGLPNQIGGLKVDQIDRENDWFGGTRAVLDLSFPSPSTHGAGAYTLQRSSDGSVWEDILSTAADSQDNFSFNPGGSYFYRLVVQGGPRDGQVSNVVSAPYPGVDTRFAGWSLDESMFITGVMAPLVGRGLTASFTVRKLSDDSDVAGGLSYQWYRVNPHTSEMTPIAGATGQTYVTTLDDVGGYQLLCRATGDEVAVGGICQIGSGGRVLIPNPASASDVTPTGFRLNLHKNVPSLTTSDLTLNCWNGTDSVTLPITGVAPLAGNASFDIAVEIPADAQDLWLSNESEVWVLGEEFSFMPEMPPHFMQSLRITPPAAGGFDAWAAANPGIPEDRRAPLDRNGPMGMQNLMAYAMGLDPMAATAEDLPKVTSLDTAAGTLHLIYRRAKGLADVTLKPRITTNLQSWIDATVVSQNTTDHGDWEMVDALISFPAGPRGFVTVSAESAP